MNNQFWRLISLMLLILASFQLSLLVEYKSALEEKDAVIDDLTLFTQ